MTDHPEQDLQPRVPPDTPPVGRRRFLRGGAIAAAATAGAAVGTALASPARAANGDPITIGSATNTGTGATKLTGSGLDVTASIPSQLTGVGDAAVVGRGQAAASVGVIGTGGGTTGAGVVAHNTSGPQLQISEYSGVAFPPATGRWHAGAIVNFQGSLFQCVESDEAANSNTLWTLLTNNDLQLILLDRPLRAYSSSAGKIARNTSRRVSVATTLTGGAPLVPPWASAVLATVQLAATETSSGWLAIAAYDPTPGAAPPAGFSTTVWSAPNFGGVTSFTSALGPNTDLWVACYGTTGARTHFYIDVVGFYSYDLFVGGPSAPVSQAKVSAARKIGSDARAQVLRSLS